MSISADFLITPQPIVVAVPPPQPRPTVAPAGDRESAQNQRRESSKHQNGPLSFRAALGAATSAGSVRAATAPQTAPWPGEDEDQSARETRLPNVGPIELTGAQASELFTRAVEHNERKGRNPVFAAAASQYAVSYFAGSSFHAQPGESLELTA